MIRGCESVKVVGGLREISVSRRKRVTVAGTSPGRLPIEVCDPALLDGVNNNYNVNDDHDNVINNDDNNNKTIVIIIIMIVVMIIMIIMNVNGDKDN